MAQPELRQRLVVASTHMAFRVPSWQSVCFGLATSLLAIGAAVAVIPVSSSPSPILRAAAIWAAAAVLWVAAQSSSDKAASLRRWKRSHLRFRDDLDTMTAFLRSAMQTSGQNVLPFGQGWEDVAPKARWPDIRNEQLRGWLSRMGSGMTPDEHLTLKVARYILGIDRNTIRFQRSRRHLGSALEDWMDWSQDQAIAPLITEAVTEHRDAIVMLAYLEIALADIVQMKSSPPPKWRRLPEFWPVLVNPKPWP